MQPFVIYEFGLFAPVLIKGQTILAHLDTGADIPLMTEQAAAAFPPAPAKQVAGFSTRTTVPCVSLPAFEFLGKSFDDVIAVVHNSPHLDGVPFPVPLTIGAATLYAHPLLLNFRELTIGYGTLPPHASDRVLPIELLRNRVFFSLQVGDVSLRTIFDTGAGMSVINQARLGEYDRLLTPFSTREVQDAAGGAPAVVEVLQHPHLSAGGVPLGRGEFLSLDLTQIEQLLGTRIDAILGINTMLTSASIWALDPHEATLRLITRGDIHTGDQQH